MRKVQPEFPALSGRKVLVVEDEIVIGLDLQMMLEEQGCVVLGPVASVQRALALAVQGKPDAVTLDMDLNGKPSLGLAVALVEMRIPFVIVSGHDASAGERQILRDIPRVAKPLIGRHLLQNLAGLFDDAPPSPRAATPPGSVPAAP